MKANFSINNSEIVYLIHGQEIELNYQISRCLFIIFILPGKNIFRKFVFKKSSETYFYTTNASEPFIRLVAIGWGIRYFKIRLQINFFNCIPMTVALSDLPLPEIVPIANKSPKMMIHKNRKYPEIINFLFKKNRSKIVFPTMIKNIQIFIPKQN